MIRLYSLSFIFPQLYRNKYLYSLSIGEINRQNNWDINRQNLQQLTTILIKVESQRLQIKEQKQIPPSLLDAFQSYDDFNQFKISIQDQLSSNPQLINQFLLDLIPIIKFLNLYALISNTLIPEHHLQQILKSLKAQYRSSSVIIQSLKLSATLKQSQQQKKDLINFLEVIDGSIPNQQNNLIKYCLSELAKRSQKQNIGLNECTVILQCLNQLGVVNVLPFSRSKFINYLIHQCMDSIQKKLDWKNVSIICTIFAKNQQTQILEICKSISENKLDEKPTSKDLVSIMWSLSYFKQKSHKIYQQAIITLIDVHKFKEITLLSDKLVDQVQALWSLNKICDEAEQLRPILIPLQVEFFNNILPKIHSNSHINNLSQFYICGMRLKTLNLIQSRGLLSLLLENNKLLSDPLMLGLCLYETSLLYPNLLSEQINNIQDKIKIFVKYNNIANMFIIFQNNQETLNVLYDFSLQMLNEIPFAGLEIISDTIDKSDKLFRKLEFDQSIAKMLFEVKDEQLKDKFLGKQQDIASLLKQIEDSINILEQQQNYTDHSIFMQRLLNFYMRVNDNLNQQENIGQLKGIGNILLYASRRTSLNQQDYINNISLHSRWINNSLDKFDLIELLQYYKALYRLKQLNKSLILQIDDLIYQQIKQKMIDRSDKKLQQFQNMFIRQHGSIFDKLFKVNQILKQFQSDDTINEVDSN